MENPMDSTINALKASKDNIDKAIDESEAVKSGKITKEELHEAPGYILYNKISDTCVNILSDKALIKYFEALEKGIGLDTTKTLIEMLVLVMTHAIHECIADYNVMFRAEIDKRMTLLDEHDMYLKSKVDAHNAVLATFKERLSELEKASKISKFKSENNIN